MKLKRDPRIDVLIDMNFINSHWDVLQDWHQHEFSAVTCTEIRVLFNTYTGEKRIENRDIA